MTEAAVFDLDDRPIREVREIMTPRPAMVRLGADDTPDEHRRTAPPETLRSGFSHFPVGGRIQTPSTRKPPDLRVELSAAERRLWRAAEAAGRKPTWLQDGRVDQDN